jgi:hypothetical protein
MVAHVAGEIDADTPFQEAPLPVAALGCYALCLRPFWIAEGWLSGPIQVSRESGKRSGWPRGTSRISMQPMARSGREQDGSG